jgi:hypothetical protein
MRKNILAAGFTFLVVAVVFGISLPDNLFVSIPFSFLNIILGLITKAPPGLDLKPESSNLRLIVDRGVLKASIYQLVFLNSKLILKRLSSVMVTVVLALVLALVGFELLFIIGALMGGVTGFSLQEYMTQRARDKIGAETRLAQHEKNDIEINYADIREVRLVRNRIYLNMENNTLVASFPRGYSARLEPSLEKIFGSKFVTEESVRSAKTTQK